MSYFKALFVVIILLTTSTFKVNCQTEYIDKTTNIHARQDEVIVASFKNCKEIKDLLKSNDILIKYENDNWVYVSVPLNTYNRITTNLSRSLYYSELPSQSPHNDSSRVTHKVNEVQNGLSGLPQGFTGKNVLIGIIDTGMDFKHPDFLDSTGKSRVYRYWDQTTKTATPTSPQPYNYGELWSKGDIDNGICTATDDAGHGTNVAGIAAGNAKANGLNKGMAPDATIIMVETNFTAKNWTLTVADACDYIFSVADSLNMPCVINISAGTQFGSHDGTDPASQRMEAMLDAKPGRIIVASAGNSGSKGKYHVHGDVTSDTSFFWVKNQSNGLAGANSIYVDIWSDSIDMANIKFATGANLPSPTYTHRGKTPFRTFGEILSYDPNALRDTLYGLNGNKLAYVDYYASMVNGVARLEFVCTKIDSTNYLFKLLTTGSGSYDAWSGGQNTVGSKYLNDFETTNIPSVAVLPEIAYYNLADTLQSIYSSYISSPKIVTVGNINNRSSFMNKDGILKVNPEQPGVIGLTSAKGPNRRKVIKPDIAACGNYTLSAQPLAMLNNSAYNDKIDQAGYHYANGGTSMASPLVAGVAALYLEKCSNATYQDFINDLHTSALQSSHSGQTPNSAYGYGLIDALNTLLKTNAQITFVGDSILSCGKNASLTVNSNATISSLLWDDLDTSNPKTFSQAGVYTVQVKDAKNCISKDSVTISNASSSFVISLNNLTGNDTLNCLRDSITYTVSGGKTFLWSGGTKVNSDTNSFKTAGVYYITVTDSLGCSKTDSITITQDANTPSINYSLPDGNTINCLKDSVRLIANSNFTITYNSSSINALDTNYLSKEGMYYLNSINSGPCSKKDSILISIDTIRPTYTISTPDSTVLNCTIQSVRVVINSTHSFLWNGGNSPTKDTNTFTQLGNYLLTINATNGCNLYDTIFIDQDTLKPNLTLKLLSNDTITCNNPNVVVSCTSNLPFVWDGGSSPTSTVNSFTIPNTYHVSSQGVNGCISKDSIYISIDTIKPSLSITAMSGSKITCSTDTLTYIASGAQNYIWNDGLFIAKDTNIFTKKGTYYVTGQNKNGCSSMDSIQISIDTILPTLHFTFTQDSIITCSITSVQVNVTGAKSYTWSKGSTPTLNSNTFTTPGFVYITGTGTNDCIRYDSLFIEADTLPIVLTVNTSTNSKLNCVTDSVTYLLNGAISYSWDGGKYLSGNYNVFNTPGTFNASYIDNKGCIGNYQVNIKTDTIHPKVIVTPITNAHISCDNDPVILLATGASSYTWNNSVSNSDKYTVTSPGINYVIGTASNGCTDSVSVQTDKFDYPETPTITFQDSLLICSQASNYQWYLDGDLLTGETNQQLKFIKNGSYFVSISENGCVSTSAFYLTNLTINDLFNNQIQVYPNPFIGNEITIKGMEPNDKISILSSDGKQIEYTKQNNQLVFDELAEGTYFIQILRNDSIVTIKMIKH
jgi:hypothetical protein